MAIPFQGNDAVIGVVVNYLATSYARINFFFNGIPSGDMQVYLPLGAQPDAAEPLLDNFQDIPPGTGARAIPSDGIVKDAVTPFLPLHWYFEAPD